MTIDPPPARRLGRRQLLQTGSLTIGLGAVLAACNESVEGEGQPGRVGYAPAATPLPTVEANDIVYLRTATSIEQMLVEVYGTISDAAILDDDAQALLDRLVEDHTAASAATADLTVEAGGEAYECANPWFMERVVPPILAQILGDEAASIPESDDPARDMLTVVNGMESLVAAMYQQMVERLAEPERRAELMTLGAQAARHAAAVALLSSPDDLVNPELLGEEATPDESGLTPLYAIPTRFGSLAPVAMTIGAPNDAGTRLTVSLETPAANSFVYEGESCET